MKLVDKVLENRAVRITPMRQLILEYFLENNAVSSLSDLEKLFPKSDRITIYRTLKTFEEKGILHTIKGEGEEIKYALCSEHCTSIHHFDQHPHFQCQKCNQVSCIESLEIPMLKLPNGYIQQEASMMIKGICPNCQV